MNSCSPPLCHQVSEYPLLSKLAGCFFMYHGTSCKDTIKITFSALFFASFFTFSAFFLVVYLSLPLILDRMLRTEVRLTLRAAAMVSSSKRRSSCMMRKMYCAVERPLYLRSHSCQRFGRSWAK